MLEEAGGDGLAAGFLEEADFVAKDGGDCGLGAGGLNLAEGEIGCAADHAVALGGEEAPVAAEGAEEGGAVGAVIDAERDAVGEGVEEF